MNKYEHKRFDELYHKHPRALKLKGRAISPVGPGLCVADPSTCIAWATRFTTLSAATLQ